MSRVVCQYCGNFANRETTRWGVRFICRDCSAWVGTHPDGRPLGSLANAELRAARIAAHDAFDRLWRAAIKHRGWSKRRARRTGYGWLAERIGIPYEACHIGTFDVETCRRVVRVCQLPRRESA